jgi:hypothetical protein
VNGCGCATRNGYVKRRTTDETSNATDRRNTVVRRRKPFAALSRSRSGIRFGLSPLKISCWFLVKDKTAKNSDAD